MIIVFVTLGICIVGLVLACLSDIFAALVIGGICVTCLYLVYHDWSRVRSAYIRFALYEGFRTTRPRLDRALAWWTVTLSFAAIGTALQKSPDTIGAIGPVFVGMVLAGSMGIARVCTDILFGET